MRKLDLTEKAELACDLVEQLAKIGRRKRSAQELAVLSFLAHYDMRRLAMGKDWRGEEKDDHKDV